MWPFKKKSPPVEKKAATDIGTLSRPGADLFAMFGAAVTLSGQNVTPETAVKCAAVSAAVRAISEPLGTLPVHVYRRGPNGTRDRDREHPAYELVHGMANPWTSATDLKRQVTLDALLHGNGYAVVVRAGGKPKELHRLPPRSVTVEITTDGPVYKVQQDNKPAVAYRWQDVLHITAPISFDGIVGESPVKLAKEAIGLALVMEQHGAALFGNGARPSGTIEHPGKLSDEAFASLKTSWDSAHTGKNAGGTAILEEGATWKALTFSSVDAQFLELKRYSVDEIARAFGVPPSLLYELGRATWGNAGEQDQSFLTYSLLPWIKRWEAAIARTLIKDDERSEVFAEFLVDDFQRMNFTQRMDGYTKAIANRTMNPNEARAREGLPPYAGGEQYLNPAVTPTAQEKKPDDEPA